MRQRPSPRLVARCFPAVEDWETHIHQDKRGRVSQSHVHALLAINGDGYGVAFSFQAPREHVAIHFVIFDKEDFGHRVKAFLTKRKTGIKQRHATQRGRNRRWTKS